MAETINIFSEPSFDTSAQQWFVRGFLFGFSSRDDAQRAKLFAEQYARQQCADLAKQIREVLPW